MARIGKQVETDEFQEPSDTLNKNDRAEYAGRRKASITVA